MLVARNIEQTLAHISILTVLLLVCNYFVPYIHFLFILKAFPKCLYEHNIDEKLERGSFKY